MNLSVHGKPYDWKGYHNSFTVKEAKYVTKFCSNILLGSRLSKNISLNIYFDELAETGDLGYCLPVDHDNPNGCREFVISIEKALPREKALPVIAHELEHVRQFARKELRNEHRKLYYWKPSGAYYQLTDKNHKNMPWEKQAYRTESWLLQFYTEHCKMYNLNF